jgi:hypothetical protein
MLTTILSIVFVALIHILIVVFAEGMLFLGVLANIEQSALDNAISNSFDKIINIDSITEYREKYYPQGKIAVNEFLYNNIELEKSYINYKNQVSVNNFYKLLIVIIIILILIYYYLKFVKHDSINWTHIMGTVLFIFIFIAIYEISLVFTTILKMSYNEDSILINILNKL